MESLQRLRKNFDNLPQHVRDKVYSKYKNTCQKCGYNPEKHGEWFKVIDGTSLTMPYLSIDHIKPLSVGGSNKLNNLQILCCRCNASKGQRTGNDSWELSKKTRRKLTQLGILEI